MVNNILVSEFDFVRLKKLLSYYPSPGLENVLENAEVVNGIIVPPTIITMDSTFVYHIDGFDEEFVSTLVFAPCPEEQTVCISVLDTLGTMLLGMEADQRKRNIHVQEILHQPEAMGELHPLCFQ